MGGAVHVLIRDMSKHATRKPLPVRLLAFVVLPVVLVLSAGTYVVLHALEREFEQRMQDEVEMVARALQPALGYALEREEFIDIGRALESTLHIGRVYGAYVYDETGELRAASGTWARGGEVERVPEVMEDGRRTGEYGEVGGEPVFSYFVPLTGRAGQVLGLLEVTRRERDFGRYMGALRNKAVISLGLALGVVTMIVLVGYYGAVGRSLGALRASMERIEGGARGHRAQSSGPREIATVARSMNAMLDAIARAEDEVRRQREERSELERKLQHSEKLAALGRLATGVAHELGTPLSVIDGKAQRALRRAGSGTVDIRVLEQIRAEVSRMEHIVRQLLDFGRSSNRQYRQTRAGDLANAARAALEQEFAVRSVRLEVAGEMPGPSLRVDPVRVEQVLVNLLRNGAQAGGTRVRVDWRVRDDAVQFLVDDDGAGVPKDIQHRLFEPFFTTKAVGEGTGLGLAVVHGIVSEHGGDIRVSDSELGGARVEVRIPRVPVNEDRTELTDNDRDRFEEGT